MSGYSKDYIIDYYSQILLDQHSDGLPPSVAEVIDHSAPMGFELPANVALLGPKPWREPRGYASRWSAAIVPFRMRRPADGTETVDTVAASSRVLEKACVTEPERPMIDAFLARNTREVHDGELLPVARGEKT